jgi:hypothetical protein
MRDGSGLAGSAVRRFGDATAIRCPVPAQIWKRVFDLEPRDLDQLLSIARFFDEVGAEPVVEMSPYSEPPYREAPGLPEALATEGWFAGAGRQVLWAEAAGAAPRPDGVEIRPAGPEGSATVTRVYESVWGGGAAIRVLLAAPRFRVYLAFVDGRPAALGVLHLADGVASMANGLTVTAFRGRGCYSALLQHRIAQAADAGCRIVVSQCRPRSTSERNHLRAGFRVAYTKS